MKKVVLIVIALVFVLWVGVGLFINSRTVRVETSLHSWNGWDGTTTEPETETRVLKKGAVLVSSDPFVTCTIEDIDMFSITVKCDPPMCQRREDGSMSLFNVKKYYKIKRNQTITLVTDSMDAGEVVEITFLGFA